MEKFIYRNPTEILFGKGMIAEVSSRVPADRPVLLVWGGGSARPGNGGRCGLTLRLECRRRAGPAFGWKWD